MNNRVFIIADHGLSLIYFLQSDIISTLLEQGVEVVLFTEENARRAVEERFGHPGLIVEDLRLRQANHYAQDVHRIQQWLLAFLRMAGASRRMNTEAIDSHIRETWNGHGWKFRLGVLIPALSAVFILRRSAWARKRLVQAQMRFIPHLYNDLFEKYRPCLVIASTPGWRLDRYILREAHHRGIPTMAVIVGWDNPSSYALPGAPIDYITCWSEIQKEELVLGSDWPPDRVHVGGIPSYDGYLRREWLIPRDEYYRMHGLDPRRKLIAYACSFVHYSPNYQNIEALARLVASDGLSAPAQLLIRLHPSHFADANYLELFSKERECIYQLAKSWPHVHVVNPVPLAGSLGYYSGEDMPEKASMLAYADIFVTVYSTMLVERAIHGGAIISACLDAPQGWNAWTSPGQKKFSLSLPEIGNWPTHQRFRQSGAGRIVTNEEELRQAVNLYLQHPTTDDEARLRFLRQEITFTNGSAGRRTAEYILSIFHSVQGQS